MKWQIKVEALPLNCRWVSWNISSIVQQYRSWCAIPWGWLEINNWSLVRQRHFVLLHSLLIESSSRPFHWHGQNATIPCHSQQLLPFLSVMYFFLPPFSTSYSFHPLSSYLAIYFLIYLSVLFPNSYIVPFWEFYFLPFFARVRTNVTLSSLL